MKQIWKNIMRKLKRKTLDSIHYKKKDAWVGINRDLKDVLHAKTNEIPHFGVYNWGGMKL